MAEPLQLVLPVWLSEMGTPGALVHAPGVGVGLAAILIVKVGVGVVTTLTDCPKAAIAVAEPKDNVTEPLATALKLTVIKGLMPDLG